jgi:hypothetical protein
MVEEHSSKQRLEAKGMDMVEDTIVEMEVKLVEKEHDDVVLVKH